MSIIVIIAFSVTVVGESWRFTVLPQFFAKPLSYHMQIYHKGDQHLSPPTTLSVLNSKA